MISQNNIFDEPIKIVRFVDGPFKGKWQPCPHRIAGDRIYAHIPNYSLLYVIRENSKPACEAEVCFMEASLETESKDIWIKYCQNPEDKMFKIEVDENEYK